MEIYICKSTRSNNTNQTLKNVMFITKDMTNISQKGKRQRMGCLHQDQMAWALMRLQHDDFSADDSNS